MIVWSRNIDNSGNNTEDAIEVRGKVHSCGMNNTLAKK
jgi:hypothetical protein